MRWGGGGTKVSFSANDREKMRIRTKGAERGRRV